MTLQQDADSASNDHGALPRRRVLEAAAALTVTAVSAAASTSTAAAAVASAAPVAPAVASAVPGVPAVAAAAMSIVNTRYGRIRGRVIDDIHVFKGVRYGADTSPNRFRPPREPAPWSGILDAFEYGTGCPQSSATGIGTSEDCLFLNVWTPALRDARKAGRPVLVYIHGGAHANGDGSSPLYDGTRLARRGDVVVVTLNHRLNVFGYGYFARLGAAAGDPDFEYSGNVGHLDLMLALRWVRDHIAGFGGDPRNVTLFGQSGGGAKIVGLMAMRAADGLYRRCVTMSGQHVTASGPLNGTLRATSYLAALGLKPGQVSQLKSVSAAQLVAALSVRDPIVVRDAILFAATLDCKTLFRHPFYPDAPESSAQVPLIIGNTRHETAAFMREMMIADDTTWQNLPERLAREQQVDIPPEWVIAHYREWYPQMTPTEVLRAAATAGRSWRPHLIQAEARASRRGPTWMYQLDFGSPLFGGRLGAYHTFDISLIFDNIDKPGSEVGETSEQIAAAQGVSDQMSGMLLQFARTGSPQTRQLPRWPTYELPRRATMVFDRVPRIEDDPRGPERRLYAAVPYLKPGT